MSLSTKLAERLQAHACLYRQIAMQSASEADRVDLEKKAEECDRLAELAGHLAPTTPRESRSKGNGR